MNRHPRLAYILLAAGRSSRFGSCKQLALIDFKHTMLEHSLAVVLDVAPGEVHLVLGAYKTAICSSIDFENDYSRVNLITNLHWNEGIGSSIATAMQHILEEPYEGVMILLADHVAITAERLKQMRSYWYAHPNKVVAAQFNDVIGSPAIFPKPFFKALANLTGDFGAKHVIKRAMDKVAPFPLSEAQCDIDTENQLSNWQFDML